VSEAGRSLLFCLFMVATILIAALTPRRTWLGRAIAALQGDPGDDE
jgi:hypothetical protein